MNFPEIFSSDEIDARLEELRSPPSVSKTAPMTIEAAWRILMLSYAPIYNRVRLLWGSPECEQYIDSLIISSPEGRSGFPPDVMSAILTLSREHSRLFGSSIKSDIWSVGKDKQ